jgi:alanine dehydrogenase
MNSAVAVFTIMASAVVVVGGLVAVARALFNIAVDIRANKIATEANTTALRELKDAMDGRITSLETRMTAVESQLRVS